MAYSNVVVDFVYIFNGLSFVECCFGVANMNVHFSPIWLVMQETLIQRFLQCHIFLSKFEKAFHRKFKLNFPSKFFPSITCGVGFPGQ
jgi:hypothetical protein